MKLVEDETVTQPVTIERRVDSDELVKPETLTHRYQHAYNLGDEPPENLLCELAFAPVIYSGRVYVGFMMRVGETRAVLNLTTDQLESLLQSGQTAIAIAKDEAIARAAAPSNEGGARTTPRHDQPPRKGER